MRRNQQDATASPLSAPWSDPASRITHLGPLKNKRPIPNGIRPFEKDERSLLTGSHFEVFYRNDIRAFGFKLFASYGNSVGNMFSKLIVHRLMIGAD